MVEQMNGKLYGVGVGPGDPELMTIKAVRIIKEADVIAVPGKEKESCVAYTIALGAIPSLVEKNILELDMPMIKNKEILNQNYDEVAVEISKCLESGKTVAMLTLGDPTVYSTYMYIHQRIERAGYDTEIISGIPSFCAAAATLNHSLVEREEPLHIYPGSYDISELFVVSGTKVLMKSARKFAEVKKPLMEAEYEVTMVENCGMPDEKIYYGMEQLPEDASYYTLIIAKEKKKNGYEVE